MRAPDYVADNAERGFNERQVCWSIIVFIFARWDEETRPRLAMIRGVPANDIKLDAFGDLRILRVAIVHNGGVLSSKAHAKLKVMKSLFAADQTIAFRHDEMHSVFVLLKQAIAALILEHTGHLRGAPNASDIKAIAITNGTSDRS